jgi:paraquat-inducible protein B
MASIIEISRTRQISNIWVVEIMSAAIGKWIVQGEHSTKAAAESDRKNWM